jgi:valacyclovir hydrolase
MTETRHILTLPDGARLVCHELRPVRPRPYPLVLLHGFTGTAQRHFGELIPALAAEYRLLAPDLRGYGASRPPNRTFPPDFYHRDAADVAHLLHTLLPGERAILLGFSDGAEVALLVAALWPERVAGVVAWGVSGVISPEHVQAVRDWLPVSAWGPERAAWRDQIIADHGAEQWESLIVGWVAAAHAIAAAGGNICLEEAAAIRCPVLLINGEGEVGNTVRDVTRLAARIPACRLEFMPNSGHAVHRDQPAAFLTRVRAFLHAVESVPASSGFPGEAGTVTKEDGV